MADGHAAGGRRPIYVWTTGSWLLYEYLEQASSDQRRRVEQAVAAGDLAWHALPFSWETEMLDRSMIVGRLRLLAVARPAIWPHHHGRQDDRCTGSLDRDGGPAGREWRQASGHWRQRRQHSARRCRRCIVWKDPEGASLIMMYHHKGLRRRGAGAGLRLSPWPWRCADDNARSPFGRRNQARSTPTCANNSPTPR